MSRLEGYPVVITQDVIWGEMDAFQHVNNTVYFRYFENIRIAYFKEMDILGEAAGDVGPILGAIECRFKAPLTYPDTVDIGGRVTEVKDDRFTLEHAVYSHRLGRIAAVGDGLVVGYEYAVMKKANIPQAWRDAIGRIEGDNSPV